MPMVSERPLSPVNWTHWLHFWRGNLPKSDLFAWAQILKASAFLLFDA